MSTNRTAPAPLLDVTDLSVAFTSHKDTVTVVDRVSFSVRAGETLGIVGESGSGKTVSSLALLGLLPASATITGSATFDGTQLVGMSDRKMRDVRGNDMSVIFQEPMTSLDPSFTIGNQLAEAYRNHRGGAKKAAQDRATEMLRLVGIPEPQRRLGEYPHSFSGGMRQRVMIAMALICSPRLLIADEPTTALDVTIQSQILELLKDLQTELGMAIIFVTHDLGVVASVCDQVAVMYAGQVIEQSPVDDFFADPLHPYSAGLLDSMPQSVAKGERLRMIAGTVPPPNRLPVGCRFNPRCRYALEECTTTPQDLEEVEGGRMVRCMRHADLTLKATT
ncbi:MAG: ABC transporter ATP-binding protein [Acidimicrobiia bacterium]|jgi:oligopeptide/dipeptide ABC transporter ATP-binding protein